MNYGKILGNMFDGIKSFGLIQGIKIIFNIGYYFLLRSFWLFVLRKGGTESLLYYKLPLSVRINKNSVDYFFELFSFLNFFNEKLIYNKLLSSNSEIFINIGANVGRIGYFIARFNQYIKHSLLVDPNPHVFCVMNSFLPKYKDYLPGDMKLFNVGISNIDGESKFFVPENNLSGVGTLETDVVNNDANHNFTEINVKLLTFEDLIKQSGIGQINDITFLIDVEGHEYKVLESIFDYLSTNKSLGVANNLSIVVEIWESKKIEIDNLLAKYDNIKVYEFSKLSDVDYFLKISN